jgi:hypothetical protein
LARALRSQGQGRLYHHALSKIFHCKQKNILLRICVCLFPKCPLMTMLARHLKHNWNRQRQRIIEGSSLRMEKYPASHLRLFVSEMLADGDCLSST